MTRYAGFLHSLLITLAGSTPPRSVCAYMVNSLLGRSSIDLDPAPAAAAVAAAAELITPAAVSPAPAAGGGRPPADLVDLLPRLCRRLSPSGQIT